MRALVTGLLVAALALACGGESSEEKAVRDAQEFLASGQASKAIERLSPLVEKGSEDTAVQLTLARALFAKSIGNMETVEDFAFQMEATQIRPDFTESFLIDGARSQNRVRLQVKLAGGLHAGEVILDEGLVYSREAGRGWTRSTSGGASTEPFLTMSEILDAAPRLQIESFESRPTRANLAAGKFAVSGSIDARALSDDLFSRGRIGREKATSIAENGTLSLKVWLADFDEPYWGRLRLNEVYALAQGRLTGTSTVDLDFATLVSTISIPEPYSRLPGKLVYSDDFTDPKSGFSTVNSMPMVRSYKYVVEEQEFAVAILEPTGVTDRAVVASSTLAARNFQDFALEIDARTIDTVGSAAYGLVVRSPRPGAGYEIVVGSGATYQVRRLSPEGITVLRDWGVGQAISRDGVNHLMVVAVGPNLSFYANGSLLTEVHDATYPSGQIVLTARGWLHPIEARFSSLSVFEP